jgi:hypothetical protein
MHISLTSFVSDLQGYLADRPGDAGTSVLKLVELSL